MGYKQYCKEPENIENYQKAKKDDFVGWHCHHRLETHTPDGKRRDVDISYKELQALGMYYNRPASELIFLTTREHNAFNKGKTKSDEARRKMAEAKKGKPKSEETRRKMREAKKGEKHPMHGKHHSEEAKKKMRKAQTGKHWYNNGEKEVFSKECPEGFVPGRLLI